MDISIQNATFCYDERVPVLIDINLQITGRENLAVIGSNGSGKTTLARCLNGILRPQKGEILIGGKDSKSKSIATLSRFIGYVFQNPDDQLFHRRVIDEVKFGPHNLGYKPEKVEELVNKSLMEVGLLPFAETNPHDLGYSQRKMVTLASALAMDTPIYILDEPTMGMDNGEIQLVKRILGEMKARGKTVILITHDMDLVAETVDRVVVLNAGQIVMDGFTNDVFGSSKIGEWGLVAPQIIRLSQQVNLAGLPTTIGDFVEMITQKAAIRKANVG